MDLGIRRNDYLAAIQSDILDVQQDIESYDKIVEEAENLLQYCKANKLRKFRTVAKLEMRILKRKHKWQKRYLKYLVKLRYKAEQYAPGRNDRRNQ